MGLTQRGKCYFYIFEFKINLKLNLIMPSESYKVLENSNTRQIAIFCRHIFQHRKNTFSIKFVFDNGHKTKWFSESAFNSHFERLRRNDFTEGKINWYADNSEEYIDFDGDTHLLIPPHGDCC
jgi:hypothetical protein